MNDIIFLFFELIKVSIGAIERLGKTPSSEEWMELYAMAKKQSLVGICFAGVQQLVSQQQAPSEMLYLQWMGMAAKIQQRNEVVNKQCVDLQKRLSACGLKSTVLKGQGVAVMYKHRDSASESRWSSLFSAFSYDLGVFRQSGDIDVYVECDRKKLINVLEKQGLNCSNWDYVHLHAQFFKDTEVEIHYKPGAFRNVLKNRKLQRFWDEHKADFFGGKGVLPCGAIVCPSARMHLFYLIYHSYRHLISGGIGLRQLMDVYFAILYRDKKDDEWLKEKVEAFGMMEFAEAMIWVMHKVFGMGIIGVPWMPNDREGRFLLNEIMIGGNFGKEDKRFGRGSSKLTMLTQIAKRNWHLASHYGSDALAAPFYYIWHFCWKRIHR